jgi:hypothetical protein
VIVSLGALALTICIALGLILTDGPRELTHPNRFPIPAGLINSFSVSPRFAAHRLHCVAAPCIKVHHALDAARGTVGLRRSSSQQPPDSYDSKRDGGCHVSKPGPGRLCCERPLTSQNFCIARSASLPSATTVEAGPNYRPLQSRRSEPRHDCKPAMRTFQNRIAALCRRSLALALSIPRPSLAHRHREQRCRNRKPRQLNPTDVTRNHC